MTEYITKIGGYPLADKKAREDIDTINVFKAKFEVVDDVASCDKTKAEIVQAITENKIMIFEYHKKLHSYYVVNETGTNVQVVFTDVGRTKNTIIMFQITSSNVYTQTIEIPILQIDDTVTSTDSTWSSEKISTQLHSIVQRLIALESGTVVTPDPPTPTETIVGTVGADNTITLSNLESGSYTLKYEDNDGVIAGYDDIAVVEVI